MDKKLCQKILWGVLILIVVYFLNNVISRDTIEGNTGGMIATITDDEQTEFKAELQKEADVVFKKIVKQINSVLKSKGFKLTMEKDRWSKEGKKRPTWAIGKRGDSDFTQLELDSSIHVSYYERGKDDRYTYSLSADDAFTKGDGVYTHTRQGINQAQDYYEDSLKKLPTGKKIAEDFLKAVAASVESGKTEVPMVINRAKFNLTPQHIESYKKQLKKYGFFRLTPGGMGTGYTISTKPTRSRFGGVGKVDAKYSKLFGTKALYWQAFDAD